jgi:extracellular elastinolytic metalloproteinase
MRKASRLWTWCRRQGTFRALATLLLGSTAAMAASAPDTQPDPNRSVDVRVEFNQGFRVAPAASQLRGVAELKQTLPDLSVTYDETTGVTRSVLNHSGFLDSRKRSGEPKALALEWAQANVGLLGLTAADLAQYQISKSVYSSESGATHLYLEQMLGGIPVYHGVLHVNVGRDGQILSVNNQMVPNLAGAVNVSSPALSAADAVAVSAQAIGIDVAPSELGERKGRQQEVAVEHAGLSQQPIVAKLMYLPLRLGDVRLVWVFSIYMLDSQHWYEMTVDAQDGTLWTRFDLVASDSNRVYHRPVEAPTFATPLPPADGRTLQTNPADTSGGNAPSPFGWHDTDGIAGAEFTTTQGNNVQAYTDTDANNVPDAGSSPDGGAALLFDFALDLTLAPSTYRPAAVTNLFHWNNLIHDIQYRYGFDEVAGNFQVNNYGRGGAGSDSVQAEAQDGAGLNNANFATPADGSQPRMQMFLWSQTNPQRDGDLDNGIIVHEYGHGISNRQVGNTVTCLQNSQQPGEGISDALALMYTAEVGDAGSDGRGIGTYALGQPTTGPGIRTQRYSTDPAINTWTYASINGMAIPHGVGSVWAEAYWKVYWKLVDFYGFSPDLPNASGGAGNQRAMLYFNEGLKNAICSPTFTDLRDSIIAATVSINGGADTCRVWSAFAPFGLGTDAISGGPNSTAPTNGFQLPTACQAAQTPAEMVSPTPGSTLPGSTVTFSWTTGSGVSQYYLYVGNSVGAFDIYAASQGSATSGTVPNLPTDGRTLYVRLWSFISSTGWQFRDYTYTAGVGATPAEMVSPTPGSTLPGSTVTFSWTTGSGVSQYWLYVGNSVGAFDIYNASQGSATSGTVPNLPTDGRTLYVRLWSFISSTGWQFRDYTYSAAVVATPAEMVSPAPGSTLPGSTVTFSWTTGSGVSQYYLYVGNSVGAFDIYAASQGTATSGTVPNLPTDGRTLYVRLWSFISSTGWQFRDYTYTAAVVATPAEMVSPTPGSTLPGSTVTFSWTTGSGVSQYYLYVGNSVGAFDIYNAGQGTATSGSVPNLPTDGRTLYVRLWSFISSTGWQFRDYTYTAAVVATPAEMVSPAPGSTLPGSSVTFSWTSGSGVSQYWLYIGNAVGAADIYNASQGTATATSVPGLPTDGRTLYVRLWSFISSTGWQFRDYTYRAAGEAPAEMVSPAPGSALPGSTVTFSWTTGSGVSQYYLYVGNSVGAFDIYAASQGTATAGTVFGLPTDGRTLYVRLWSFISSTGWQFRDYTYRAAGDAPADMINPAPGSALPGSDVTFSWTTGSGVSQYYLYVGNSVGAFDIYAASQGTATAGTVFGLPTDGRTLYVRLWSYINSTGWQFRDYTYQAAF